MLIPWPPGGSNDIVGRMVAQKMSESTRQQFVVDNRGGASGTIGAELVARAEPDGYTIMIHSATHVGNPHLFRKLGYDTLNDFTGITPLARQVGVLVVQDPVVDYFDPNDAKALQAIAVQLATMIENAKLLMAIHTIQAGQPTKAVHRAWRMPARSATAG